MSWKPPWSKLGAIDSRARALEEAEAALTREEEELRQQVEKLKEPPTPTVIQPIWRATPDTKETDPQEITPSPQKRNRRIHRAQQKRDRNLFILLSLIVLLVIVLLIRAIHFILHRNSL